MAAPSQSLANVAWATACAGRMRAELLRPLQARALELANKFSDRELKQFYQAELTLRLEAPDSCAILPQPHCMLTCVCILCCAPELPCQHTPEVQVTTPQLSTAAMTTVLCTTTQ